MKMLKRLFPVAALSLLMVPALGHAQGRDTNRIFIEKYDLDATTTTYCVTGDSVGRGANFATTSGASTTVTAVSGTPFDAVAVGDTLYFNLASGRVVRYITAKADGTSITIDTAITLTATTGNPFDYRNASCGTAATSGWMNVEGYDFKTLILQIDQLNVTGGISVKWQCRGKGDQVAPVDVYPGVSGTCPGGTLSSGFCNYTAVTGFALVIEEPWTECRVGMKIGSADDGTDTGSAAENINIYFTGTKSTRP